MADIHNILAKHFASETTSEEEVLVEAFKSDNQKEYTTLKQIWLSDGLKVRHFDHGDAWKKVSSKKPKKSSHTIKFLTAAIALLLLVFLTKQFLGAEASPAPMLVQVGTADAEAIVLSDGSKIFLNEAAQLSYPESFDGKKRTVKLDGEAYFEIARDVDRPFTIETNHSEVRVLGTSFNINTKEESTKVAVTSGKVEVAAKHNKQSAILVKNQAVNVTENNLETFELDDQNFLAWKTGVFSFEDQPIAEVVTSLNTYYKDEISLTSKDTDCILTANFNKTDLADIIEIIKLTCDLSINQKATSYELY